MTRLKLNRNRYRFGNIGIELYWLTGNFRLSLALAEREHAVAMSVCLWLFSFYAHWNNRRVMESLERLTKRSDQRYGNGRVAQIYWHEGGLWWSLWDDPMEWRSRDPWWGKIHVIRPLDILFGSPNYRSRTIRTERTVVPMPEGGYPATVTVNEDSWKRPRWPWAKKLTRCEVKPDTPIPFPGKGENSWDCGEDASHSLYGCFPDAFAATIGMTESVMRSRIRYGGGWGYKPESLRAELNT